ncbi:hypothetical protein BBP40_000327 [Aspergillus hancockii]|nr:hypothetical protein BBP40_000327 [Aspergillus hancockii]
MAMHKVTPSTIVLLAGAAEAVLRLSAKGKGVLQEQVRDLVDRSLRRLVDPSCTGFMPPTSTGLILSGGILQHKAYYEYLISLLADRGTTFAFVERVQNAVSVVATSLARAALDSEFCA